MNTPTIPGPFVVQQHDPPGCIHILGPHPQNRFIARIEEGTMEDAYLLAASRDLLSVARKAAALSTNQCCDPAHHELVIMAINALAKTYPNSPDL